MARRQSVIVISKVNRKASRRQLHRLVGWLVGGVKDVFDIGECLSSFFVFRVEGECAPEALAGFGVTLERTQNKTKVEKRLLDRASLASGGTSMNGLRLLQASHSGEKRAQKDVVRGIRRRNIDSPPIPALREAKSASLLVEVAEAIIDQVALIDGAESKGAAQRAERLGVTGHSAKRVGVVEPDEPVGGPDGKVAPGKLHSGGYQISRVASLKFAQLGFGFIAWHFGERASNA